MKTPSFSMFTPPHSFFLFSPSLRMKGWEGIRRLTGSRWSGWSERSSSAGSRTTPSLRSAISRLLLLVQEFSPAHAAPAPPPHCPPRVQTLGAMEVDTCKTSSTAPMAFLSFPALSVHLMSVFSVVLCSLFTVHIFIMVHRLLSRTVF